MAIDQCRRPRAFVVVVLAAAAALTGVGCKKKPPPRPAGPDPNSVVCPPNDRLTRAVEQDQKGRAVRTSCVVFAPGYYWLGAAVSYDAKTSSDVRVHLLSGGLGQRISEIEPIPTAAIADLIKKSEAIEVRIRKAGSDNRLVRPAVLGKRAGAQADEIGMVLQLVAHAPPRLLWVGAGDELRNDRGCTIERTVDFEMPFNRLEMITTTRAKGGPDCRSGGASQEQIESKGVALKSGRPLAGL